MYGFLDVNLIHRPSHQSIEEYRNLTIQIADIPLHFLDILQDHGLNYYEIDKGIHMLEIQLQDPGYPQPLIYSIATLENFSLIIVTDSIYSELPHLMEQCMEDLIDSLLPETPTSMSEMKTSDTNTNSQIDSSLLHDAKFEFPPASTLKEDIANIFQKIFTHVFASLLLPDFLVAEAIEPINEENGTLPEILLSLEIPDSFYGALDGTRTIGELATVLKIDIWNIRDYIFILWQNALIYLRLKYYLWTEFIPGMKTPRFLEDGSEENVALVNKFQSSKIIRILASIGTGCSYKQLLNTKDITTTKLDRYLTELLRLRAIQKKRVIPKFEQITDDAIPLLILQGLTKDDLDILARMQELKTDKSFDDIVLEMQIDPARIWQICKKYQIASSAIC